MYGNDLKVLIPAAMTQTYLNTGTLGPTPSPALGAAETASIEWQEVGPGNPQYYLQARQKSRDFAHRIERQFPGGTVSLMENNTTAMSRVLWGMAWQDGDEIILSDQEYGATVLLIAALKRRYRIVVHRVAVDDPAGMVGQMKEIMNERVKLVIMSHVSYLTGWQLPVAAIGKFLAPWSDVRYLIDGAQALGNIEVHPETYAADFYVFCGHKWMLAPMGWAGVWVRKGRLAELSTVLADEADLIEGDGIWGGHSGTIPPIIQSGIGLEYGTREWTQVTGWSVTWDYFEEEGFTTLAGYQKEVARYARQTIEAIEELRVVSSQNPEIEESALLVIQGLGMSGEALFHKLLARQIVTKSVPAFDGVRLSWAVFNTQEDVLRLGDALKAIAAPG